MQSKTYIDLAAQPNFSYKIPYKKATIDHGKKIAAGDNSAEGNF
jgi:hypothetical protein